MYIAVGRWWECLSLEASLNMGRVGRVRRGANIKDSTSLSRSLALTHIWEEWESLATCEERRSEETLFFRGACKSRQFKRVISVFVFLWGMH